MTTYFRTAAGDHKHASDTCALVHKRSAKLGEVRPCTADEVAAFAPCPRCCASADVAAFVPAPSARCANAGVERPNRKMSTCKSCGKEGTVVRATGALRAHDA